MKDSVVDSQDSAHQASTLCGPLFSRWRLIHHEPRNLKIEILLDTLNSIACV